MNDNTESTTTTTPKRSFFIRMLTVLFFIIMIIILAWSSIKIVGVAPQAFSSLASLAESVNQNKSVKLSENANLDEELTSFKVTSNSTFVNTGDSVKLDWDTTKNPGSYTLSYTCLAGVNINLLEDTGARKINCDTNYNIGNIGSADLTVDSQNSRYANVEYTISFLGTNDTSPRAAGTASFTVVNNNVSSANSTTSDNTITSESKEPTPNPVENQAEPAITTSAASTPVYQQEYIYTVPVSDTSGRTDLATKFISTGTIVGDVFFTGEIKQNEKGAIQFEVKNYGTKTSADWTFSVTLPDNSTYTSKKQEPLKPNERAVLTIGFSTTNDSDHTFTVLVDEKTDKNSLNNNFKQKVTFVK